MLKSQFNIIGAILIIIGLILLISVLSNADFIGHILYLFGIPNGYEVALNIKNIIEPLKLPLILIAAGSILYGINKIGEA